MTASQNWRCRLIDFPCVFAYDHPSSNFGRSERYQGVRMILRIITRPNPILYKSCLEVPKKEIEALESLISDMRETMRDAPGVGLAAPQIGHSLRVIVIEDRAEYFADMPESYRAHIGRKPVEFMALINPRVLSTSWQQTCAFEGCLSDPGSMMAVLRPTNIEVQYDDLEGNEVTINADGWLARILQHEIDHLNGKLCRQRCISGSVIFQKTFERRWKYNTSDEILRKLRVK